MPPHRRRRRQAPLLARVARRRRSRRGSARRRGRRRRRDRHQLRSPLRRDRPRRLTSDRARRRAGRCRRCPRAPVRADRRRRPASASRRRRRQGSDRSRRRLSHGGHPPRHGRRPFPVCRRSLRRRGPDPPAPSPSYRRHSRCGRWRGRSPRRPVVLSRRRRPGRWLRRRRLVVPLQPHVPRRPCRAEWLPARCAQAPRPRRR